MTEQHTEPSQSDVILVTGMAGGGKSVAMHALEDAGFFCVDNLPAELLLDFLALERQRGDRRVAIAVDVRSAGSLPMMHTLLKQLSREGVNVRSVFLDANTEALMRRFSETRRPHPLRQDPSTGFGRLDDGEDSHRALLEAIALERELLAALRAESTVLDTSQLRPAQLRAWIRDLVMVDGSALTLIFESFAFKHGVPSDADFVFDVRVLPNPYYDRELRPLTGRDPAVQQYLVSQPEVGVMLSQIADFLKRWLPNFAADQRSYLTVAIGCTGGQHRSVYLVEMLARLFAHHGQVLKRHRELDAR